MGNRIYGCDDCLAVCPWNKFAVAARESAFHPRIELTVPRLRELVQLDDAGFREFFRGSPVKRIGRDRFIRNVLIAIGNSGDPCLAKVGRNGLRMLRSWYGQWRFGRCRACCRRSSLKCSQPFTRPANRMRLSVPNGRSLLRRVN